VHVINLAAAGSLVEGECVVTLRAGAEFAGGASEARIALARMSHFLVPTSVSRVDVLKRKALAFVVAVIFARCALARLAGVPFITLTFAVFNIAVTAVGAYSIRSLLTRAPA
jgi:hypothetical protein